MYCYLIVFQSKKFAGHCRAIVVKAVDMTMAFVKAIQHDDFDGFVDMEEITESDYWNLRKIRYGRSSL